MTTTTDVSTDRRPVRVECEGQGLLDVADMREFQGQLKSLSEADYQKLRAQILDRGFSFPIAVWQHESSNFILDGHQRRRTLLKLREEGHEVPPVPIVVVNAESYTEAKRKLIAAASQFGRVENQGLYEFIEDAGLTADELLETARFPELDLGLFKSEFYDDIPPPDYEGGGRAPNDGKELGKDEFDGFTHKCPRCGFEWDGGKPRRAEAEGG